MAYSVMASRVMACVVMAYAVVAYVVKAHVVMAMTWVIIRKIMRSAESMLAYVFAVPPHENWPEYGPYNYGPYSYGP